MQELERQIEQIPLDQVSTDLDSRIELLRQKALSNTDQRGRSFRPFIWFGLGNIAALIVAWVVVWFVFVQGEDVAPHPTTPVWHGIDTGDASLVVRDRFLIDGRALLVCWSHGDSRTMSVEHNRFETSYTKSNRYRHIALRRDVSNDGTAWQWSLLVPEATDLNVRLDPPTLEHAMKDGRKVGLMLTITTEDSQFDDQQLIKAQHQTLPPDADRDDVYTIADIRRVMSES